MAHSKEERREAIQKLNDALRTSGEGGQVFLTSGLKALDEFTLAKIIGAVKTFEDFNPDNDPYGEHDCAVVNVDNQDIIWKIDYYNLDYNGGSPDPADPKVTRRVLTIMLSKEY